MRDPRGEYHEGGEHENERSVVLGRRVLRVKKEERERTVRCMRVIWKGTPLASLTVFCTE